MSAAALTFDAPSAPQCGLAARLELELITERAAFDALETEWNALFDRAGRPTQMFQTFNWNWHWANHYLSDALGGIAGLKLSLVTARRGGRLIMVWPLVSERVRGITQIFWMGEPVSQYGDVVIDDVADALDVMRAGWTFLTANTHGDIVRLKHVRVNAAVAPLLAEIGARVTGKQNAPYMDLASAKSFAEFEQRYSAKSRRNRRRLLRRFEEQGSVVFERHAGGPEARALAVKALELKAEWLNDRGLVSQAIADSRMSRFFADAAEGASRPTNCLVSVLKAEGEPAALQVSFNCKGRQAMHINVFNLKYEKAAAGILLLEQTLRDEYAAGTKVIDMLAPGDNYKLDWCDQSAEVCDWVKPLSLAGFTYARIYLGLIRSRAKAAIGAMPESLRRLMANGYAVSISLT